jgi:hypothetical protein
MKSVFTPIRPSHSRTASHEFRTKVGANVLQRPVSRQCSTYIKTYSLP